MFKIRTIFTTIMLLSASGAFAMGDDLHLAGNYTCSGYDSHDGAYQNGKVTLTLDKKNSDFNNNYGAYHVSLVEADGTSYIGEATASGNSIAIYFENQAKDAATDRGVGIATVTHDKDSNGKVTTAFHKFYYEPTYQKGGHGYETCVKQG